MEDAENTTTPGGNNHYNLKSPMSNGTFENT